MADGQRHLDAWRKARLLGVLFSAIGGGLSGYFTDSPLIGGVVFLNSVAGYCLGYFLSPDLDQVGITSDEGRMMKSLSIFGVLLVMMFLPYAFIMRFVGIGRKGHRNFFSHTPWIGTLIRLVWVYFPLYRIAVSYIPDLKFNIWYSISFLGQLWGLGFSDLVHWIMDNISAFEERRNGTYRNGLATGRRKKKGRRRRNIYTK